MKKQLSNNEWLIMETMWSKSPMFLSEIMEQMQDVADWKHSTFLTYLKKLVEGGYVSYKTVSGIRSYSPALGREECIDGESDCLRSRMSRKSTHLLLANLIRESGLEKDDYEELKVLISNLEKEI